MNCEQTKMRREESRGAYSDNNNNNNYSDTDSIASDSSTFSDHQLGAPIKKRPSKKSARFSLPLVEPPRTSSASGGGGTDDGSSYVEITLDIRDDSVAVHSVQAAGGGGGGGEGHEDPELAFLAKKTFEGKSASFRSSLLRSTSSHIKQVSQELKRLASFSRRPSAAARRFDRTKSAAAHALKGLRFITGKTGGGGGGGGWPAVEKRFDDLTASSDGLLSSSLFGECIGRRILV